MQTPFTGIDEAHLTKKICSGRSRLLHCCLSFLLLSGLLVLFLLPGCHAAQDPPRPVSVDPLLQPDTYQDMATALSWNGNLHYQNFVIYNNGSWFVSGENSQIARLDPRYPILHNLDGLQGCQLATYDDWLFYTVAPLNTSLRKIMTDGSNAVRISTFPYQYLIADSDYLFGIMLATGQVMRMGHDGTGRQLLFDGYATEIIYDGSSLFICSAGDTAGLFRVSPVDGTSERLLYGRISSLNKTGTRYYYIRPEKQNRVYLWESAKEKESRVTSFSLSRPFIIQDEWLYYLDSEQQNCLMRLPLKGDGADETRLEKIVDDSVGAFVILPDAIYYRRPDGNRIYRVSLPDGTPQRID